jgi:hypothetical protein
MNNMNNMNTQRIPLLNQVHTMPQQQSLPKNSNTGKMLIIKEAHQQWNNSSRTNNMNFPVRFDTSLVGMAAAAIFTDHPMFMMHQQNQQQQTQERVDAYAITSQVLAELADDTLFADDSPVSEDIFDLEPIPIAAENRLRERLLQHQQQPVTSRLALLEDTLNQVLNDEVDFFTMEQSSGNFRPVPRAFISAPMVPPSICNDNHFLKRSHHHHHDHQDTSSKGPSFKQRRTTEAAPTSAPSMPAEPLQHDDVALLDDEDDKDERFRDYQSKQWVEKFQELNGFKTERGHSCVPHTFKENPPLARWVKRQRYQYKLKNESKPSTMTDERILALERMGFVWDSHGAAWEERWSELRSYQADLGHCNVPSNYKSNPQLATWVKCQRRQYKLFWNGKSSNITLERISKLETLGFEWELRGPKKSKKGGSNDADACNL